MQLLIMKHDIGNHSKGDIVEVRASGTPFGGSEPEAFVLVEAPDAFIAEFDHLNLAWNTEIKYSVVGSNVPLDGYRLKLYSDTANSGFGEVTKADAEEFITVWGGNIISFGANEVIFDITIIDAIKSGAIRGVAGIVGCNNPKVKQDYGHVALTKRLIAEDVLVLETGCAAVASGKAGLLVPEAADMAGPGLSKIAKALGIPPVLHMGSCVDCSRILVAAGALASALGVDISDLPLAGAAPEWYSQKAVSIGSYFVASGVYTVLGLPPRIYGSENVTKLLADGLNGVVGAAFAIEPDPDKAAKLMLDHIDAKRKALGI